MTNHLIKPELLNETNRDFDFFKFDSYAKNLRKSLESSNGPAVTMLLGGYGTGKSVLLYETKKLTEQSEEQQKPIWVFFECWQYPDKRDLWEGLILEIVGEIKGSSHRNKIQQSYSDIASWKKGIADFLKDIKTAAASIIAIGALSFFILSVNNVLITNLFISLSTAIVIILLAAIEFTIRPDSKASISRLSDYKDVLKNALLDHDGTIYIVLEDVDRAGELGTRFFETVAHFIKSKELINKNIKIVVPVSDDTSKKELNESVEKVADNILYFKPSYDSSNFLSEVFSKEFLDAPTKQLLISTINPLLGSQINVRKMKHTLRNSIIKYKRLNNKSFKAELAICIAVEFSKYMNDSYGSSTIYSQASNHYKHNQLYEWATNKGMINISSDDPEKEIEPQNYFKKSPDNFDLIRYIDQSTNMRRSKPIYNREYYISRAYFDDL